MNAPRHTRAADAAIEVRGFAGGLVPEIEDAAEHFNGDHNDALLLIARFIGCAVDAVGAEISSVDTNGVVLATTGTNTSVRVDFAQPVDSLLGLQTMLLGMLARARTVAGSSVPLSTLERELAQRRLLRTFVTTVSRSRMLAPNIKEITFSGGLDEFAPRGPDQFLWLMAPRPGSEAIITDGFTLDRMQAVAEDARPFAAYYTVRAWRPMERELDMWFVLHDHAAGVSSWAATAQAGARVAMWGPRIAFEPPPDTNELLLIGDETALPAIAAIIESHPRHRTAVVVEAQDAAHAIALPGHASVTVHWTFRGSAPAGTNIELLDLVRRLRITPTPSLYAFGAGETRQVAAIRRYLRRDVGLAATQVRVTGYWRRTKASAENTDVNRRGSRS